MSIKIVTSREMIRHCAAAYRKQNAGAGINATPVEGTMTFGERALLLDQLDGEQATAKQVAAITGSDFYSKPPCQCCGLYVEAIAIFTANDPRLGIGICLECVKLAGEALLK